MAKTFGVDGMTCGGCAKNVDAAITKAFPGASVSVDLDGAAITVEGVEDIGALEQVIEDAGFDWMGEKA